MVCANAYVFATFCIFFRHFCLSFSFTEELLPLTGFEPERFHHIFGTPCLMPIFLVF
eukprot:COSAG05_NODE_17_length_35518_cov_34.728084_25_plen_57_part_00